MEILRRPSHGKYTSDTFPTSCVQTKRVHLISAIWTSRPTADDAIPSIKSNFYQSQRNTGSVESQHVRKQKI